MPWTRKKEPERFGVVSVRLNTTPPKGKRATYAMASVQKGRKVKQAALHRVAPDGAASFVLPLNRVYDLCVFHDLNNNQALDADEPNGRVQGISPTPPTAAATPEITLAFGHLGAVPARPAAHRPAPAMVPPTRRALPAEVEPYSKFVPPWLQEKLLR